jgi:hypothetical protein
MNKQAMRQWPVAAFAIKKARGFDSTQCMLARLRHAAQTRKPGAAWASQTLQLNSADLFALFDLFDYAPDTLPPPETFHVERDSYRQSCRTPGTKAAGQQAGQCPESIVTENQHRQRSLSGGRREAAYGDGAAHKSHVRICRPCQSGSGAKDSAAAQ